ncbi:unnamed protein product, partial [Rotaria sp. Silwood2]
ADVVPADNPRARRRTNRRRRRQQLQKIARLLNENLFNSEQHSNELRFLNNRLIIFSRFIFIIIVTHIVMDGKHSTNYSCSNTESGGNDSSRLSKTRRSRRRRPGPSRFEWGREEGELLKYIMKRQAEETTQRIDLENKINLFQVQIEQQQHEINLLKEHIRKFRDLTKKG